MLLTVLLACAEDPLGQSFLEPFDGATGVSVGAPLVVHVDGLNLPEGEPVSAELLQVVDLDRGGFVEGARAVREETVVFEPDGGWAADTDYGWALIDDPDEARQIVVELPETLLGEALFSTRAEARLLDAVLDEARGLCLLFSSDPPTARLDLVIDGEAYEGLAWTPVFLGIEGATDGVTAACYSPRDVADRPVKADQTVHWQGADDTWWAATVVEGDLLDAFRARHRYDRGTP